MSSKEERIERRREIIQKRYYENYTNEHQCNEEASVNESEGKSLDHERLLSEQQIAESLSQLHRRKDDHIKDTKSIREEVDGDENARRTQYEKERSKLIEKAKCGGLNDGVSIEIVWDISEDETTTRMRELHEKMEEIKKNYNDILAEKDSLIDDFEDKLKHQDQIYLEGLRKQEHTIDLTQKMAKKQISAIKKFCDDELKAIEEAFQEDRRILINEQTIHLKSLADKKREAVKGSLQTMQSRKQEKDRKILNTYDSVNEEYNALRNKLQDQVSKLEREWSVSRGLHVVSADQIEYDHREIETKNSESEQKIKRNKKRIVQFKEELNRELERTRTTEKKERKKNDSLELDCRRLEGQYRNLLSKLHRFEVCEGQKYFSALSMHREEASMLSIRIRDVRDEIMGLLSENGSNENKLVQSNENEIMISTSCVDENAGDGDADLDSLPWSQLESAIVKYHGLLEKYTSTIHTVSQISNQNAALQRELDASLNDDIKKSLIVPPNSY
jgi:hypothetical protein